MDKCTECGSNVESKRDMCEPCEYLAEHGMPMYLVNDEMLVAIRDKCNRELTRRRQLRRNATGSRRRDINEQN